jgi:hypothetical protein
MPWNRFEVLQNLLSDGRVSEPASTALKVRQQGGAVRRHAHYQGLFTLAVHGSALVSVKTGKDTGEDAVAIASIVSL